MAKLGERNVSSESISDLAHKICSNIRLASCGATKGPTFAWAEQVVSPEITACCTGKAQVHEGGKRIEAGTIHSRANLLCML
jgi:hypothetical protein